MFTFIQAIGVSSGVLFLLFLIVGLVLCKKHSFSEGVYFFAIIIISQLYTWISPLFVRPAVEYYENKAASASMSIGELIISFSYVETVIQAVAFIILIRGLYKYRKLFATRESVGNKYV